MCLGNMKIRNGSSQAGFRFQSAVLSDGCHGAVTSGTVVLESLQSRVFFLFILISAMSELLYSFCSLFYSVYFFAAWFYLYFLLLFGLLLVGGDFLRLSLMDGKSRQRWLYFVFRRVFSSVDIDSRQTKAALMVLYLIPVCGRGYSFLFVLDGVLLVVRGVGDGKSTGGHGKGEGVLALLQFDRRRD